MTRFQRTIFALAVCFATVPAFASNTTLGPANGGTGCNTGPGVTGQIPISDGTKLCPADPIVSYNVVTLINAQAATGTVAGTAQRLSLLSASGTLTITYAGITGSPVGCTLQVKNVDFLGNSLNDGGAITLTPANGTSAQKFTPAAGMESSDQMSATYACGTYPTAGTLSVEFTPGITVFLANALPAGTNAIGTVTANAGTNLNTSALALDATISTLDNDVKADPCGDGHAKSYAFYDASTNGATQLVALSSGKIIYVCSYSFSSSSATANTLKLVYGTASNCATGQTAITPGMVLQAAASTGPIGKVNPNSAGLQTIASNELCLLTNAAQPAQAEVSYVQQ